jgi:RND family efflux transporter MFP subunit
VRFEIPSAVADVSKQRTEITRAQARLENARAAQARARDLFDRGVGARREMEEAARETADAEADLASAQAGAVAADTVAARSVVQAAFDGVVARRAHNPGDFVEPTAADAVLRVLDPRRLEVTALVPVADVSRVRLGAPAHIVEAEGTPRVSLAVAARPIAVQPGTATVPVRLAFRGAHQYPVGAPLTVEIDAESHGRAVLVPASAVVREGADTAVFVAAGSKAQRRTVTTGIETSQLAEIKSGLKAGEVVITSGQNGLPDGADITLAKPGGDGADEKPAEDAGGRGAAEKK